MIHFLVIFLPGPWLLKLPLLYKLLVCSLIQILTGISELLAHMISLKRLTHTMRLVLDLTLPFGVRLWIAK
jgi:hypothetical protein